MIFGRRTLRCKDARGLLSAHIDQHLPVAEERALQAHLAACPTCAEELRGLRSAVSFLRDLPLLAVPRSFTIEASATAPRLSPLYFYLRNSAAAVAALLVGVLALGYVVETGPGLTTDALRAPDAASAPLAAPGRAGVSEQAKAAAESAQRLDSISSVAPMAAAEPGRPDAGQTGEIAAGAGSVAAPTAPAAAAPRVVAPTLSTEHSAAPASALPAAAAPGAAAGAPVQAPAEATAAPAVPRAGADAPSRESAQSIVAPAAAPLPVVPPTAPAAVAIDRVPPIQPAESPPATSSTELSSPISQVLALPWQEIALGLAALLIVLAGAALSVRSTRA